MKRKRMSEDARADANFAVAAVVCVVLALGALIGLPWLSYNKGLEDGRCEGAGGQIVQVDGDSRCLDADTVRELNP